VSPISSSEKLHFDFLNINFAEHRDDIVKHATRGSRWDGRRRRLRQLFTEAKVKNSAKTT